MLAFLLEHTLPPTYLQGSSAWKVHGVIIDMHLKRLLGRRTERARCYAALERLLDHMASQMGLVHALPILRELRAERAVVHWTLICVRVDLIHSNGSRIAT